VLPDGIVIVPLTVTGPTNAPLLEPDIDILDHVWAFFKKNVDAKEPAVTVASVGVPMSNVSPSTTPKKVSDAAGFPVNVIWLPVIVKAEIGSWITDETEIINDASFPGDTAVPPTVKLNGPGVDPVNDPDISSKI
jgi:hypothetical protein